MRTFWITCLCICIAAPVGAQTDFLIGWWTDPDNSTAWAGYAASGANFLHLTGATEYDVPQIMTALDIAQSLGLKVSISLTRTEHTSWPWSAAQFTGFVNAIKGHPAIWGWYLADEPELSSAPEVSRERLLRSPGYYPLIKAEDPARPAWLVFSGSVKSGWDGTADAFGVDLYPGSGAAEFGNTQLRRAYDIWKAGLNSRPDNGAAPFIAVMQGFGSGRGPWRDLTAGEFRYLVFSAVAQGVDKILFWCDRWANRGSLGSVAQLLGFIREMRAELEKGVPNDSAIVVSESADRLAYLHGAAGNRHIVLAVNIANRSSIEGAPLPEVRFSLPAGFSTRTVEVLNEGRSIPVKAGAFSDAFARFEVHAYAFTRTPEQPPARIRRPARERNREE